MIKNVIIEDSIASNIEILQYEVESRKEIIAQILSSMIHVQGSLFENYQKQYHEYFVAYNKAKSDMLKAYNIPASANWTLNFDTKELTYEV